MKSLCIWCLLSIGLLIGLSGFGSLLSWLNDAHGRGFAPPETALLTVLLLTYVGGAIAFLRHRRNRFF